MSSSCDKLPQLYIDSTRVFIVVRSRSCCTARRFDSSMKMGSITVNFLDLPNDCFRKAFLSCPLDACVMSTISPTSRSMADSDDVWEHFLPSDYEEILARSVFPVPYSSKKDLFFRLSDSIPIDGGSKIFSLDRHTGKKCFLLGARELLVVWGDDDQYWRWGSDTRSRFAEVAMLNYVWWLEVKGVMDTSILSPRTTYGAYLVMSYEPSFSGLDEQPAEVSVEVGSSNEASRSMAQLARRREEEGMPVEPPITHGVVNLLQDRADGWMEIELGEFYNFDGRGGEVSMRMMQVNGHIKAGLIVEGIELRPKLEGGRHFLSVS